MKMRVKAVLLAVFIIAAGFMGARAISGISAQAQKEQTPQNTVHASVQEDTAEYYLRDCGGYIAVFRGGEPDTPINVTDIETETLNDTDREKLMGGIPADGREELLSLLEDFSS